MLYACIPLLYNICVIVSSDSYSLKSFNNTAVSAIKYVMQLINSITLNKSAVIIRFIELQLR